MACGASRYRIFATVLIAPLAFITCDGAAARPLAVVDSATPPGLIVPHGQVGPDWKIRGYTKFAALPRPKKPEPATETSTPRPDKRPNSSLAFGLN